jgi:hypothetical protein
MTKRNLAKRLDRLEALAREVRDRMCPVIMAYSNGGPAQGPTVVIGPDGRFVWWKPPAGFKVGELAHRGDDPEGRLLQAEVPLLFIVGCGRKGPTTAIGPDGRLVWLEPPEGCKAGEPIEDSAAATASFGAEPRQACDHNSEPFNGARGGPGGSAVPDRRGY